ncbi:MAG: response regulator [Chloroflexi bacterium]|nr:response regulator [Chloroflexota bacterium]
MELGAQRHAGSLRRARIAVLNDDTTFLQLIEELLEQQADYEVATWKNWHGAYEFVKQPRPDLVILDIVRGHEEHGWTVHNLLTLDPETRPIPVLVCSAAVQSLQAHQALLTKLGICALPKPFDLNALLETIRQRLAQHGHEH